MTVIDYAAGPPAASAIRAAGHDGAVRYLSPPRPGADWMTGKPVRRAELDDFDAHDLRMAFVWQYGKESDADVLRGYAGGVADATAAQERLDALDCPSSPVFFAVDFDITLQQWNSVGADYFRGAASVLGRQRVGIYGHSRVCHWAGPEDGVVAQVVPGRYLCWITRSWSGGETGAGYGVLYQRIVDTPAAPGPKVGGVTVDVNDVLHPEWGWRPLPDEGAPTTPAPHVSTIDDPAVDIDLRHRITFGRSTKGPKRIIITHTTENQLGTPAANIVDYQVRTRSGSYHRLVDASALITLANTDDWQVWATGNIGNDVALHVSIVWWAKTDRPTWLSQPALLHAVARVYAYWSRTYDIPLRKLTRAELADFTPGVAGHLEAQVWGNTDHWDPGYHFPYDVVLEMARRINAQPAAAVAAEHRFMEVFMSELIQSRINPSKEFAAGDMLGLVDACTWETHIAIRGLYTVLGLDFQGTIDAAIAADRAGDPVPPPVLLPPTSSRKA